MDPVLIGQFVQLVQCGPAHDPEFVRYFGRSPGLGVATDGGCECDGDRLPCFDCYSAGRRELPV